VIVNDVMYLGHTYYGSSVCKEIGFTSNAGDVVHIVTIVFGSRLTLFKFVLYYRDV